MNFKSGIILILFIFIGNRLFAQTIKADNISGCDSIRVTFSLIPPVPNGTTISWNFGNGKIATGDLSPSVMYNIPGKYAVSCVLNGTLTINAPDTIKVYKTPSSAFSYEDSIAIDPYFFVFRHLRQPADSGTLKYYWQFSDGQIWDTPQAEHYFSEAGIDSVILKVTAGENCSSTTIRSIGVINLHEVPNVFTPDDDNKNDYFQVRTYGDYIYTFSVYTRSGVLVYRSKSPSIIWDGRSFSGQELTGGIYYYTIESIVTRLKGFVYLIRER